MFTCWYLVFSAMSVLVVALSPTFITGSTTLNSMVMASSPLSSSTMCSL